MKRIKRWLKKDPLNQSIQYLKTRLRYLNCFRFQEIVVKS